MARGSTFNRNIKYFHQKMRCNYRMNDILHTISYRELREFLHVQIHATSCFGEFVSVEGAKFTRKHVSCDHVLV